MSDSLKYGLAPDRYRRPSSIVSKFAAVVFTLPILLFVFSLLGRYFFFAELICNFRCQILCLLIPGAVMLLVFRRWWLGSINLIAIVWCMFGVVWIYIPVDRPTPGSETLRVMSFNVLTTNSRYEEVLGQIKTTDPDVVTILEYSDDWDRACKNLNQRYPHHIALPRWHGFGIAIYSKHPLSDVEVVQLTRDVTDNPLITANVSLGDQTIRLAAVHALSPINRYRMDLRNRQFTEAAQYLGQQDLPTVVMGDFNCVPWSPFLSDFLKQTGYRDSRQGFGYQATWNSNFWPLWIPIDHAFVSDKIHVHDRYVGRNSGSDHFPIVFEISTAR